VPALRPRLPPRGRAGALPGAGPDRGCSGGVQDHGGGPSMSTTQDALTAIAGVIVNAGLGQFVVGSQALGSVPSISMKNVPQTPDRVIVLNMVTNGDNRAG